MLGIGGKPRQVRQQCRPLAQILRSISDFQRAGDRDERLSSVVEATVVVAPPSRFVLHGDEVLERKERRIKRTFEVAGSHQRGLGRLEKCRAQHEQVTGEVAGVHGRYIRGP